MKYALKIAEDGRILSATYPKYASEDAIIVDYLPDGDIFEYRYIVDENLDTGELIWEFVHDPLPVPEKPEPGLTTKERITALEEENAMLMECILEMSEIVYA